MTQGAEGNFAKAVALQDWFRTSGGFRYSLEQRSGSGMDLLAAFVTNDRVGYCEQFAAAMAAMGRVLGIPSRVVVGFLDGDTLEDGRILYTSDDRHAWPEMYFAGVGWVRFEPTPGSRVGRHAVLDAAVRGDTDTPRTAPSDGASEQSAPRPDDRPVDTKADDDQGLPIPAWPLTALLVLLVLGLVPGSGARHPASAPALVRRPGPPRRRCLGRAARDRTRPRAGLARATLTARAGPQRGRPGAGGGRGPSSRWRGCWSGWSGDATDRLARPDAGVDTLDPELRSARWTRSSRGAGR